VHRSDNDRPQHTHFDSDSIIKRRVSFNICHGPRWRVKNSSKIWVEQDFDRTGFGLGRIWTEQDLGWTRNLSMIWAK